MSQRKTPTGSPHRSLVSRSSTSPAHLLFGLTVGEIVADFAGRVDHADVRVLLKHRRHGGQGNSGGVVEVSVLDASHIVR